MKPYEVCEACGMNTCVAFSYVGEIELFVLTFAPLFITLEMHHVICCTSIVAGPDHFQRQDLSMNRTTEW